MVVLITIVISYSQNFSATKQGASSVQFTLTMTNILICCVVEEFLCSIVLENEASKLSSTGVKT